jgi:hypothetical protein
MFSRGLGWGSPPRCAIGIMVAECGFINLGGMLIRLRE